jgi:hypothetical protein
MAEFVLLSIARQSRSEGQQRRERFLALTLLLLEAHEIDYSGREKKAVQRARGISDEVLAEERRSHCRNTPRQLAAA